MTGLQRLIDAGRQAGADRFVLDDGWFGSRRDDTRGLGDWAISPEAWPEGFKPLVKALDEAGLEFGLWVEPEMVNPDSDLYRAHPDWILAAPGTSQLPAGNSFNWIWAAPRSSTICSII